MRWLRHLAAPQCRTTAINARERAGIGRCTAALGQLAHQHVLQADTATFARHAHGQLLVVHVAVLLDRFGVHRVVVGQHVTGLARGLSISLMNSDSNSWATLRTLLRCRDRRA